MILKEVKAKAVKDSRKDLTIQVVVKTSKGKFKTSAPSGKSVGKYEAKPYAKSLRKDIEFVNRLNPREVDILKIEKFWDLIKLEKLIKNRLGANSLFALEASLLKALAYENKKELYEFLGKNKKLPMPVGNAVEGGLHSRGKKPDFQEFLFIPNTKTFKESVKLNKISYKMSKKLLKAERISDEGGWESSFSNEKVLDVMNNVKTKIKKRYNREVNIGIDAAASSLYKNGVYNYKNLHKKLTKDKQINLLKELIKEYCLFYIEDPLNEDDFLGFGKLLRNSGGGCLIVGDDLITTNPERLKKAIRLKSINAVIVKPNQIGSLLKVKKVIEICKKYKIKTIISHRSGETKDNTIADLCVGFGCDFIKTGIYGRERVSKLKRLIKIEKELKRQKE